MKKIRVLMTSCALLFMAHAQAQTFTYDFTTGYEGWTGNFADYPFGATNYDLVFTRTTLPAPLNTSKYALKLSGNNHSDDLFMFIKRKITGLMPNTVYNMEMVIELASNAPTGVIGTGGAPGTDVWLKAGASLIEPLRSVKGGFYRMNILKGNQADDDKDMNTIGHIGVASNTVDYTLITRNNLAKPFQIKTDAAGEVWVCVGTDSGYESVTTLYYNNIKVTFSQASLSKSNTSDGLNEAGTANLVSVYPNPTAGNVTIDYTEQPRAIEVYSIKGEKIAAISDLAGTTSYTMDLSNYEAGFYFVKVYTGETVQTEKIIVSKD